jgi:Ca2+-binding RTX toxin-like protein
MKATQRRLHSYRQGRPAPLVATPALARGAAITADGETAAIAIDRPDFSAQITLPRRPRGWLVTASADLEADGYATVRVTPATPAALAAAHAWLRELPETRGLPVALGGEAEALEAAADLGPAVNALILERDVAGPPVLVPTLVLGEGHEPAEFLDAELAAGEPPALNHAQRRRLARGLARAMRGEARGLRAAIAAAASALALTLSMGLFAAPASAVVTADYNVSDVAQLRFTSNGAGDSLVVGCQADGGAGFGDDVFYTVNGGAPQTIAHNTSVDSQLECTAVFSITVDGAAGADSLDLSGVDDGAAHFEQLDAGEVTVAGGNDNDTIDGSDMGASLQGGALDDVIDGGPGGDTLVGNTGNDDMAGLGGSDTIDYSASATAITGSLGGTMTGEGTDTIAGELLIGTTLGDNLTATAASTLLAGSGSDTLIGSASADSLSGEAGADSVNAGGGADTVHGGSENDTLLGAATGDSLLGDAGTDSLDGGAGGDFQFGGSENDTLVAGDTGNDSLNGDAGNDMALYTAAAGAVTLNLQTDSGAGAGTDTLTSIEGATGSANADSMTGDTVGAQSNTLFGGGGADTLTGQQGADSIAGEGAADTILGGGNTDTLDGGAGNDTLDPSSSSAGELLAGGTENDQILAPDRASTLNGNAGLDTIAGSGEADTIDAGGDNDSVLGDDGNDTVGGGAGNDTVIGDQGNDSVLGGTETDSLDGRAGADTLAGEDQNDTLRGSTEGDSLLGGVGAGDRLIQEAGALNPALSDSRATGEGTDTLDGQIETASIIGEGVLDASAFTLGSVTLEAGSSPATLRGGTGSDSLLGGGGTDRIEQSANANQTLTDTLLTGEGNDTLSGNFRVSLAGGAGPNSLSAANYTGLDVTLDGQGDNDTLAAGVSNAANDSIVGGTGTDRMTSSRDVSMTLTDTQMTGQFGDLDTLSSVEQASLAGGGSSNDLDASAFSGIATLDGAGGNDTVAGAAGADSLVGGSGTVDRLEQTANANQTLSDSAATGDGNDSLSGFELASLTGGAAANVINASGFTAIGGVTMAGLAGNDTLRGSVADDLYDGGADTDRMIAEPATTNQFLNDTLLNGLDQEALLSVEQASLTGDASANVINASAFSGSVTLAGDAGDDFLVGAAGSDSIDGGTHAIRDSTSLSADSNMTLTDTQLTGLGTDTIANLEFASLFGGASANDIDASAFSGAVEAWGSSGNDTFAGAAGNDDLFGEGGTDRVEQSVDASQTIDNNDLTGDGNDFIDQIEEASLSGGPGANDLNATAFTLGSTTLDGLAGADTLDGSPSGDRLLPGTGADSVAGAGGTDRVVEARDANLDLTPNSLTAGAENDTLDGLIEQASLQGGAGANQLTAAAFGAPVTLDGLGGADTLVGSSAADSLTGGTENDALQGRGGVDAIDGGGGTNTADYSDDPGGAAIQANLNTGNVTGAQTETLTAIQNLSGTSFGDTLTGSAAANTLIGNGGPDQLTGNAGSDALFGNAGADTHNSQDGGTADTNDCGADTDTANADIQDSTTNCETVANPPAGQPGGPPLPPPPADTKAPALTLGGKAKQKDSKQIKVEVSADEAATVEATGTIKIAKPAGGKGKRAKSKKYDLKAASASVQPGATQTLKLKLSGKAKKALKKVIKKKTSKATVSAVATDAAGNPSADQKLKVKVKK